MEKRTLTGYLGMKQIERRRQKQDARLQGQAVKRAGRSGFFDDPVHPKGECEGQRNPRRGAVGKCQVKAARRRQPKGKPLPWAQAFSEKKDAHQNTQEGVDEMQEPAEAISSKRAIIPK
ncbi:MAG: hypothetical protein AUK26_13515 [Syntrophaceae bacterium CG2_30_58_14]|nr:MAG: hypothetical protein AUK26_13515 [Syntrophaceae bacterium CG2_30_58_14]